MTERSCAASISKEERHILDWFYAILWWSVNSYSVRRGSKEADLATGRKRQLTTGKRAERTKHEFRTVPDMPLCHWSSQLFDLRTPSSTDVPVLLLNEPNK